MELETCTFMRRHLKIVVLYLVIVTALPACNPFSASAPGALRGLSGHSMEVDSLAWSPDSKMLISGSFDGSARVWDVSNGHTIATFGGFGGTVYGVAWSADGKYVADGG